MTDTTRTAAEIATLTSLADYARQLDDANWAETIAHAVEHGYLLGRHADPVDDGAEDIDADEAEAVAAEDPSLVYVYQTAST